ncbi:MAG: cell wall hydrolase [Alphaproteobacteria bacterium]|nr:cell wall hydrolase [Alphaproteobacteria bacterium]
MKNLLKIFMMSILLTVVLCIKATDAGRYKATNDYMLATILWHEARGEGYAEMQKVANVAINRYEKFAGHNKEGYTLEIGDILTASGAFEGSSAYLNSRMTNQDILKHINLRGSEGKRWKQALNLAAQALSGQLSDLTHGATHFHVCDINKNGGYWAAMKNAGQGAYAIKNISVGKHCFYRNIQMGAMKVNGHRFYEGKVTGNYSNGSASIGADGGGSGEGSGDDFSYSGGYNEGSDGSGNGSFLNLTFDDAEYKAACEQAKTEANGIITTPPNLFNTQTLKRMSEMLQTIYASLGRVYVIGQGLMCFSTHAGKIDLTFFKMVNIPYWLAGFAIYLSAFFITISIGLFFVDVAFKIGFALLMLPISISLWPFEATRGKLTENFSVIIRNSMLFAMVSIGISYALTLIENSAMQAINDADFAQAINDNSMKGIGKQFALSGTNTLVIFFCVLYAYFLIQASVKDYLDRIFSDNVFGGSSPMHELGVQAFGNMASNVVLPLASIGTDMVRTTVGTGLVKAGDSLKNISQRRGPQNSVPPAPISPQPTPTTPPTPPTPPDSTPLTDSQEAEQPLKQTRPNRGTNPSHYGRNNNYKPKNKTFADLRRERQKEKNLSQKNNVSNPQSMTSSVPPSADTAPMPKTPTTPPKATKPLSAKEAFKLGMQNADSSAYSLSAGTILKNASKIADAPFELLNKKTYTQLAHLDELMQRQKEKQAQRKEAEDKLAPNLNGKTRMIMRAGQLFMRTAKDTKNEAAYAAGSILSGLGNAIRVNPKSKNTWDSLSDWYQKNKDEEIEEELRKQAQAETDANLSDQFIEKE